MHIVFRALTEKIEKKVIDNFEVCVLNLQVGLRKIKVKKNEKSSCFWYEVSFRNY